MSQGFENPGGDINKGLNVPAFPDRVFVPAIFESEDDQDYYEQRGIQLLIPLFIDGRRADPRLQHMVAFTENSPYEFALKAILQAEKDGVLPPNSSDLASDALYCQTFDQSRWAQFLPHPEAD